METRIREVTRPNAAETFNTAGEAISRGATVQAIQTKYATAVAVQKPRNIHAIEKACKDEAAMAGESCFYGWGTGDDRIEGPSVDCAMIAVRNWGNCAVTMEPMIETPTSYIFTAAFVDLETGFTIERQFRQSKNWKVYGRMDEERKADVRFQLGASKATRNVVLKAMPAWLIDRMMDQAKSGVREKLEAYIKDKGIDAARSLALRALEKYGVTQDRIEAKFGKKMPAWAVEELVILKGDLKALESGQESSDVLFPDPKASEPESTPEASAGDATTNTGHDNAPKPTDAPTDEDLFEKEKRKAGVK